MAQKKTLYELLEVQPDAPEAEIQAAYDRLTLALQTPQPGAAQDDRSLQERVLRLAYTTLINPQSRAAYDAEQAARRSSAGGMALVPVDQAQSSQSSDLRTDAMLLRAEAIALRANALELKANALDGGAATAAASPGVAPTALARYTPPAPRYSLPPVVEPRSNLPLVLSWLSGSIKHVVLALGTLVVIAMAVQAINSPSRSQPSEAQRAAQEKIYLQEYYQTYGVRPANMAEARLLDEQRRREADAQRQQQEAKRRQQEAERERAAQETRDQYAADMALRRAEQASRTLQYAEDQARVTRELEERRRIEAQRSAEEAERRRIQIQQYEWRRTLERR